jgi:prepilin-type N-terminal cleavage/methylation domain-containing protein
LPKKCRRSRRGYTLVEVLVVTAVGSVIFGVAVVSLAMLWRIGGRVRTDDQLAAVRARLAEQFRADVRAATALNTQQQGDEVTIRFEHGDDGGVEYAIRNHVVQRRRMSNGNVSAKDRFVFGEGTTCQVTPAEDKAGERLLRLELDYPADNGRSDARRRDFVLARLGADRRFVATEE